MFDINQPQDTFVLFYGARRLATFVKIAKGLGACQELSAILFQAVSLLANVGRSIAQCLRSGFVYTVGRLVSR